MYEQVFFAQIEVGQFLPDWRPGHDYKDIFSAHKNQGGGVALELSHEFDYMMYLFGFPSPWNFISKKVSHLDTNDIEVNCDIIEKRLTLSETDPKSGQLFQSSINKKTLFEMDTTYKDELKIFIDTIKQGSKPETNLHDGLQVLELLQGQNV